MVVIKLFEHDEREFYSKGICDLHDYMEDLVTEETNGMFELEFDYPLTGLYFRELRFRRIIYCKPNPYSAPEPFRIYAISTPINGIVSISARHISYDTSGYPMDPFTVDDVHQLVVKLNNANIVNNPFTFSTNISRTAKAVIDAPTSMRNVMGGVAVDAYAPEYMYNKFNIQLLSRRGTDTNNVIRYGLNLIDYTQEENIINMYTSVYPYWTNHGNNDIPIMKTLPEKTISTPGSWAFSNVMILDLSSNFKEEPSHDDMRTMTSKYIVDNNIGIPEVSLSVSFLHLDNSPILLGDSVVVDFVLGNIKTIARCVKTTYSPRLDRYMDIELGKPQGDIANTIVSGFSQTSKQLVAAKSYVDSVVGSVPGATTSASALVSGTMSSVNKKFSMNIDTGDFNIGGVNGVVQHTNTNSIYEHGNKESSTLGYQGFTRGGRPYHNLMHSGSDITVSPSNRATITLPSPWANKTFEVMVQIEDTNNTTTNNIINTIVKVVSKDLIRGSFIIEGYHETIDADKVISKSPIKFRYVAIGG